MNQYLFNIINGLAYKNGFLDTVMIIFSKYVPLFFMAILAAYYFYGVVKKQSNIRCVAVNTFLVTVINLLIAFFIGMIYYVPRPFVHHKVNLLFPHVVDASFPSDHAIGTMSIAVGLEKGTRWYGKMLVLLSLLVGFSRVFVGHHFPADVAGGFAIAIIVNYLYQKTLSGLVSKLYLFLEKKFMDNTIGKKQFIK